MLLSEDLLPKPACEDRVLRGRSGVYEMRVSSLSNSFTFSSRISSKIGLSWVYLVRRPSHSKWFYCWSCPNVDLPITYSYPFRSTTRMLSSIFPCRTSCSIFSRCNGSILLTLSRLMLKSCAIYFTTGLALSKS